MVKSRRAEEPQIAFKAFYLFGRTCEIRIRDQRIKRNCSSLKLHTNQCFVAEYPWCAIDCAIGFLLEWG